MSKLTLVTLLSERVTYCSQKTGPQQPFQQPFALATIPFLCAGDNPFPLCWQVRLSFIPRPIKIVPLIPAKYAQELGPQAVLSSKSCALPLWWSDQAVNSTPSDSRLWAEWSWRRWWGSAPACCPFPRAWPPGWSCSCPGTSPSRSAQTAPTASGCLQKTTSVCQPKVIIMII